VERVEDSRIHRVFLRSELKRREKHTRNRASNVLTAQAPRARFFRRAFGRRTAPQQGTFPGEGRGHHALADRLENFGLTQIRNQKTEGSRSRGASVLGERP